MSDHGNVSAGKQTAARSADRGGVTPLRLVVWILGGGLAVCLIVIGVVGILTKAR
jgi:hypothetical protein